MHGTGVKIKYKKSTEYCFFLGGEGIQSILTEGSMLDRCVGSGCNFANNYMGFRILSCLWWGVGLLSTLLVQLLKSELESMLVYRTRKPSLCLIHIEYV